MLKALFAPINGSSQVSHILLCVYCRTSRFPEPDQRYSKPPVSERCLHRLKWRWVNHWFRRWNNDRVIWEVCFPFVNQVITPLLFKFRFIITFRFFTLPGFVLVFTCQYEDSRSPYWRTETISNRKDHLELKVLNLKWAISQTDFLMGWFSLTTIKLLN